MKLLHRAFPCQRYLLTGVCQIKNNREKSNLIGVWQTFRNQEFTDKGQSGPGNSRSAPLPSLALGPWKTVLF